MHRMNMMRGVMTGTLALLGALLTACGGAPGPDGGDDVEGPFTGPVQRFVVDGFVLPTTSEEARAIGADLDGDGTTDNQLYGLLNLLVLGNNLSTHGSDMIRAGAIASVVELQADDLADDEAVGLTYLGAPGAPAITLGGRLVDGRFVSNRTATARTLGLATLWLPAIADVDPSVVTLDAMEAELVPDGAGGYTATLRGGLGEDALAETARGLRAMILADPQGHPDAIRLFDVNRDGDVTLEEITTNQLITSVFEPDAMLWVDGAHAPRISAALQVHLTPCAAGACTEAPPEAPCFDRVQDGDETDVDCGGACRACAGGEACAAPADCQSAACSEAGVCAAPTCSDGVVSGFETDVDCGWHCGPCALGQACDSGADCASGRCNLGTCA